MINIQKVIKYLAILFAVFIIFSIFFGIISGFNALYPIFNNEEITLENLDNIDIKNNIENIEIDLKSTNLIIKIGEKIKVETNNESIKYKENNKTLFIEDKTKWYKNNLKQDLIIYVPSDYKFNNVSVEHGAGKIEIEELITKNLELDLGAGKAEINKLNVTKEAEINGGAGEIIINNSNINNLEFNIGVGKTTLTSILTGKSEINAGVGETNLNLTGSLEDYKIYVEKGIGKVKLNNEKIKNETTYGTGLNLVEINGGIGNINITLSR